jgi:hypothetical protein
MTPASFFAGLCLQAAASVAASPEGARWIAPASADAPVPAAERPCPILRRSFSLGGKAKSASLRIIGLGHFELRCNGAVVGDAVVNQAWSQCDKTLYWQEFDLAPYLREGENVLGVLLGNSFWHVGPANDPGRFVKTDAMPDFSKGHDFLLWLEGSVETEQGTKVALASDGEWKWMEGPLVFSNIYAGEDWDARLWPDGWDRPGFDAAGWKPVAFAAAPSARAAALPSPPIRAFDVFAPSDVRIHEQGLATYVFPQNCSALLRFTVSGPAGSRVRFKTCEYLEPSGRVKFTYTWGTGKAIWHDYVLRGGASETHQILFCYVGCQYVEVSGAVPSGAPNPEGLPVLEKLELVHVRAANREVGSFSCSSELQNSAHRLIDWSIRSNMSHVATDCPHREKNGWQEQNWHMARALSYRYDVHDWYTKIAADLRDTQLPDGHVPTNCPNYLVGIDPHGFWNEAPEWGIAAVLVPWHLWRWYGDKEELALAFDSMRRYVNYLTSIAKDGIVTSNLGDWYDYGHGKGDGESQWTPKGVSGTATWAMGAIMVSKSARVLDRPEDERRYRALYEQIRDGFLRHFYDPEKKCVRNEGSCQAGNSVALYYNLVPPADREDVLDAIVADLEARDYQQTTGEVMHDFLVRALAENGRGDVLHRVYARTERGSYGYMVKTGLTTLPESWDAQPGTVNSMNHFMLGHLVEWHFAYVAGIRQEPDGVGWKRVLFAPQPGPLTHAEASFVAPTGRIASAWRREGDRFRLTVTVPEGVEARAELPDGTSHVLASGETTLECALE